MLILLVFLSLIFGFWVCSNIYLIWLIRRMYIVDHELFVEVRGYYLDMAREDFAFACVICVIFPALFIYLKAD